MSEFHSHDLQPNDHCHSHDLSQQNHDFGNDRISSPHCALPRQDGSPEHKHDLSGATPSDVIPKASICRWFCNIVGGECLKTERPHSHSLCPWTVCREPQKCDPLISRSGAIDFIKKVIDVRDYNPTQPHYAGTIYEDKRSRLLQYVCTREDKPTSGVCGFGGVCDFCGYAKIMYL